MFISVRKSISIFSVPTVPQNLMITMVTSVSFFVTWGEPLMLNAPSVYYNLIYRDTEGMITPVENLTTTEFNITNLEPFIRYYVSVQACSIVGCSAFTDEESRITGQEGLFWAVTRS